MHFAQDKESATNTRPTSAGPERQVSTLRSALRKSPSGASRSGAAQRPQTARVASRKDRDAGHQNSSNKLAPWRSSAQESPLHVLNDEPIGAFTWLRSFEAQVCCCQRHSAALHARLHSASHMRTRLDPWPQRLQSKVEPEPPSHPCRRYLLSHSQMQLLWSRCSRKFQRLRASRRPPGRRRHGVPQCTAGR